MVESSRRLLDDSRLRHGVAAALAALALAGCGDELRVDVHYQVVGLVAAEGGACGAQPRTPPEAAGATKVRFTFRDHGATGPGALRCDLVVPRGTAAPVIAVPRRGEPVDAWVEYFTDDGAVVARGHESGVELTGGGTVTIYAGPPESYTCAPAQAALPRAFHSATRLPDGEVLLLGGLVGAPDDAGASFLPSDGAYVTASAEIYDPAADRVSTVLIPGLHARAFHEVVVLGVVGDDVLLLVSGGVSVAGTPTAAGNVAAISGSIGEAPWRTVAADDQLMRAGSAALAPELLTYSMRARGFSLRTLDTIPPHFFGGGAVDDAELGQPRVVQGGEGGDTAHVLTAAGDVQIALTGATRVGGTVVATSPSTALWLGGDVAQARLYDELTQLDSAPALVNGPAPPGNSNRAFGAATRIGGDVLYVGGLTIGAAGILDDTPTPPGFWITPSTMSAAPLASTTLEPAAYLAIAQLPGGDALVSGGVHSGQPSCLGTLACPSKQSVRVNAAGTAAAGTPGLARYGHRLTRLADGTILVSGGFTADGEGRIHAVSTLERFEPARATDDPLADLAIVRAPGEVAMDNGAPLAPCTLVSGSPADAAPADAADPLDAEPDALDLDAMLR